VVAVGRRQVPQDRPAAALDAADKKKTDAAGASFGGFQPEPRHPGCQIGRLAGGSLGTRGSRQGNAAARRNSGG
jgi:hypothetical protein